MTSETGAHGSSWQLDRVAFWLGPAVFVACFLWSPGGSQGELTPAAMKLLGVTAWMALWWITEAVPIAATSMLPLALFPLFGIAKMSDIETPGEPGRKLTKTGMIFGTPEYMSPEQAAGKPLDHRVDVYALGVILYELTTGRVPFVGDSFMGILTQHMFEDPPPLREVNPQAKVSSELELVIARALS